MKRSLLLVALVVLVLELPAAVAVGRFCAGTRSPLDPEDVREGAPPRGGDPLRHVGP